jgi:hypothetical protein
MGKAALTITLLLGLAATYFVPNEPPAHAQDQAGAVPDVEPDPASAHNYAPFVNFCNKSLLSESNGRLYCNWGPTFAHACLGGFANSYIQKGAILSGPTNVGKCDNGSTVVKVTNN